MTLRLADPDALYPTRVEVDVPGVDKPLECVLHFRLLEPADVRELLLDGDVEYFAGVVADWEEVEDHEGNPLEFSRENVEKLGRIQYVVASVVRAYGEFVQGLPGKTSARSRVNGAPRARAATN
ncbi:MAG: hypothetical protein F4X59_17425 [Holophagales bacterium]|nr:hypothetical protein [Holophagales bacterium]MYC11887.1 hypothetical protein [Holophagales bacterium]